MTKRRSSISSKKRFFVLWRDDFTCQYCGRMAPHVILHVDHKVSVADGGTDDEDNLAAACVDCNLGKGATSVREIEPDRSAYLDRFMTDEMRRRIIVSATSLYRKTVEAERQATDRYWREVYGRPRSPDDLSLHMRDVAGIAQANTWNKRRDPDWLFLDAITTSLIALGSREAMERLWWDLDDGGHDDARIAIQWLFQGRAGWVN